MPIESDRARETLVVPRIPGMGITAKPRLGKTEITDITDITFTERPASLPLRGPGLWSFWDGGGWTTPAGGR